MLSTSDTISLSIGLGSIALAILTIFATILARNTSREEDIEMQPLSNSLTTNHNSPNEHETTLRVMETVLGLFHNRT
ncbi:hypothetical protein L207DRAFT_511896 [Hyaloscypha variabilis F]|uniref:Uncharacterized protein n=1 Tax=Hyaloscypha variabilis (strain UAMH 11265 / GT02V1 / F) TaxID=1149755 RepID=A0A2J6RPG4_HYAVF|nr:hypothetical protein L207DRAFT_511896 [Hyaloscypha variabilis F]